MNRSMAALARETGGRLVGDDAVFGSASIDSRTVEPGALFVALPGERHDAHDFVGGAAARGAAGALVARPVDVALPQVVVGDTLGALTSWARACRRDYAGTVVGITGSNGKTTVKEMTGAILARTGECLVTQGNLNNHIGVPLMLTRLRESQRCAVIEMGANHLGEIAHLASIARPRVGMVINAGPAHLEGFGGLDGVARGKGEMFESLGAGDTAVVNADDRYADYWRSLAAGAGRVVTFGVREAADFRAARIEARADGDGFATSFDLECPLGTDRVTIGLAGDHNVMNALAAAAAAAAAGADLAAIAAGLAAMRPVSGRLALRAAAGGARLIDDSYNANPGSVKAGLRSLAALPGEHWLVLGEMRELGPDSARLHAEVGAYARETGVARLYAVGDETRHAVEAYGAGGEWYARVEDLVAAARPGLGPHVTVLVKGSRSNRLERVADALAADGVRTGTGVH